MRSTSQLLAVGALALLISVPAFAQTPESSILPVTEPLDVGGTILQPGTYAIRVLPSFTGRNKVQVTSPDLQTVYATVLTVPHPLEPNEEVPNTTFVYYPAEAGAPRALRTWFAPNPTASQGGHDIVYEESRAKQLARLAKDRVVSYRDVTDVAQLDDTELRIVMPDERIETYTYVAPVTPAPMTSATTVQVAEARPIETRRIQMPATASSTPLIALLGLLALGVAVAIRVRS